MTNRIRSFQENLPVKVIYSSEESILTFNLRVYQAFFRAMAGYRPTQIRKPSDETDFEKNCVVLFKELLNDPNVSRVGTRGQKQDGVDIKGNRDRDPHQIVGVQCKLKEGRNKLTKKEVDEEVMAALLFKPPLNEYFIVATSKNDTRLQQHALALSQAQQAAGRRIRIEVWGWDMLQEKINQCESAKQAFDPGFSPALAAQGRKLDVLIEAQTKLPTKEDLATFAMRIERDPTAVSVRLPSKIADRELRDEFAKVLKRRGFSRTNTAEELGNLADRAINGDLSLASIGVRTDVIERAARANAQADTRAIAERFRNQVATLEPSRDLVVVDALLKEAAGDADAALRELKVRNDIDARSALFGVLMRQRGVDAALDWARSQHFSAADFTPPSSLNLILKTIEGGEFDVALEFVSGISASYVDEIAALRLLRAQLMLAAILPQDQKAALFGGLPLNPRQLQFAAGAKAEGQLRSALADIEALLDQADELELEHLMSYWAEFALWLRLEIADFRDAARIQLAAEIANPETTLRRVRLALAYGVPFNTEALQRNLVRQKEIGGWTSDERFAAFLIAYHSGDAKTISDFFDAHRDDLFAQSDLTISYLAATEIEALARAGRFADARQRITEHSGKHLADEQAKDVADAVAAIERDDEVEVHRQRYEETGNLGELRMLVAGLRVRRDTGLLALYAPQLAQATLTREDFDAAIKSLYQTRRDVELLALAGDLPDLVALDLEYEAIKGWSLFRMGRTLEARAIAGKLLVARNEASDRELAINTAVETGDWGDLQAIVAREAARMDMLSAKDAMRMARLALEIGSPYVDRFRDAALAQAPDDPQVYLVAYTLAMERGEEYQESKVHEWFQKAVTLSGPSGPIKTLSFREVVDHVSGRREHIDKFDKALRRAEIPTFMIARSMNRRLLDLTLGQARQNGDRNDGSISFPVFAFSGAAGGTELHKTTTVGLDISALITLEYLGLLTETVEHFERIVISPRTLSFLFAERQFIRVQQPSQVSKARRVQALIASGRLKVFPRNPGRLTPLDREIGRDLATLLTAAATNHALVARSAPVAKLGSYLDEEADMTPHAAVLTDTHSILSFLFLNGKIDAATRQSAEAYLQHVDKGWENAPVITPESVLYLDDLTVTYLDHVGLLGVFTRNVRGVFVHEDVNDQAREMLRHSEHTEDLLTAIERIRFVLAAAIESGRVIFSARHAPDVDTDEYEDPLDTAPTLDLLSDLSKVDLAVADDRCLNKLPHWIDSEGRTVRCANTMDIIASLRMASTIDEAKFWQVRHQLRAGAFYVVPLDVDELMRWLRLAPVADKVVRETPELRAIRENIGLPIIHDAFLIQEEPWLACMRFAIYKAIGQVWIETDDVNMAEARADWLWSVLPDPLAWCLDPNNDALWAAAKQQAAVQISILMVFTEAKKGRQRRYFEWLDTKLASVREKRPEIWDTVLESLKSYIGRLWEIDDDES